MFLGRERWQNGIHDSANQVVVKFQQFMCRCLGGVRPQQRSARHFRELRCNPQLLAHTEQRSCQYNIHFRFPGDFLQIGRIAGILRRRNRRAHHQVFQPGKGNRYRLRQAVRQKLNLLAGPQHAKRQNHEPSQRARMSFRLDPIHQQCGPQLLGHSPGARIAVLRLAR